MMRLADYIAQTLVENGIRHVFMITGGGAMHLNDALGRHRGLVSVFCHHEQACAMAAESYARLSNRPAAVNVTTGPGGINALNGVYGAYVDSICMIVISGQVKRETMKTSYDLPLRQLGDQEADIVKIVAPICKFATVLREPNDVRFVLEKALWLARTGRPGPVWIDVPIDVQAAQVDPDKLRGFDPRMDGDALPAESRTLTGPNLGLCSRKSSIGCSVAERPVILAGAGVRIADAHDLFLRVIDKLGIPVTTGWNAHDVLWNAHPLYAGRPGSVGDRGGNFAVQNSDFLLVLGSRLNVRQVSYNWQSFARAAFKVMVDIDQAELSKPTLSIDIPVHADLREFLSAVDRYSAYKPQARHRDYVAWCRERVQRYPTVLPQYWQREGTVNPYCFMQALFAELEEGDIVVTGDGTACVTSFQAADLKRDQRLYTNSGSASMGYDLPAAVGACYASGRRVICLAGDGSIMLNLQELQTIVGNRLPVKLFILNNDGYSSIRQTQRNYFPDNIVGCGPESGLTFPDFVQLCAGFGIPSRRCAEHESLTESIRATLSADGPQMLEVMLDKDQPFAPKLSSRQLPDGRMVSSSLEDLYPFLPRDELAQNMLIPMIQE